VPSPREERGLLSRRAADNRVHYLVELEVGVFVEEGKPKNRPGEKPAEQGENQQDTQLTFGNGPESNQGHIGGRHPAPQVLGTDYSKRCLS